MDTELLKRDGIEAEDRTSLVTERVRPELLAPAGDRTCLLAAVENGADAIYFGLSRHNARMRAHNFDGADLPEIMAMLHRRGVRGYVTLNTLVFPSELADLEGAVREAARAGVDAIIVQDLGLVRMIRAIAPELEIHGSTQMSITSEAGVAMARELGCSRVILARELSLSEIGRIRREADLPVEVFVHGALCVAYSGQCLTSEALGGRSANRGECAQACRMPYQIVCDGEDVDLKDIQYLLSPQDLAAYDLVPRLIELGVASLKIEGRLKSPEYVANITRHYRMAIDAAWAGQPVAFTPRDVREMQLSFSRGFSHGFLDGNNHKVLVRGDHAKKRGIDLGVIEAITRSGVRMTVDAPVKPGDGLVFDGDEANGREEQGGRVYEVIPLDRQAGFASDEGGFGDASPEATESRRRGRMGPPHPPSGHLLPRGEKGTDVSARPGGSPGVGHPDPSPPGEKVPGGRMRGQRHAPLGDVPREVSEFAGRVELRFGREAIDLRKLAVGQRVWKTDDPELTRRLRRSFEGGPGRRVALDVRVVAVVGEPLRIEGRTATGLAVVVTSDEPLARAESLPADESLFREQLGRLGGTVYELGHLEATISGAPMVPKSLLNHLRRDLTARLDALAATPPARAIAADPVVPALLAPIAAERARERDGSPEAKRVELSVLCRRTEQIEAAVARGIATIYADYQDIKRYPEAVAKAHEGGARIYLATPRIEKPGEGNLFKYLARQGADGLLVRNAGGLRYCREHGIPFVADFSMNAANPLTVALFKERGAQRVTASYDLNVDQLLDLLDATPPSWLEVVIHQRIPMFHMEHCVFCAFLSPGTDATNCGRPCDEHDVKLRDRVGAEHPLTADVGCRNTLFNAIPQTAAEFLPRLVSHGARHLRIEFLDEDAASVERIIGLYRDALEGRRDVKKLWRELKATGQYGVTRGPLAVL